MEDVSCLSPNLNDALGRGGIWNARMVGSKEGDM